jgi:hypothetical protein
MRTTLTATVANAIAEALPQADGGQAAPANVDRATEAVLVAMRRAGYRIERDYATEQAARDDGQLVYRNHRGLQAWCLCAECSRRHDSKTKKSRFCMPPRRRTRHDHWALVGQDSRIRADLAQRSVVVY